MSCASLWCVAFLGGALHLWANNVKGNASGAGNHFA